MFVAIETGIEGDENQSDNKRVQSISLLSHERYRPQLAP